MADSFLDRRLAELRAGDQAVPLEYDALREAAREHLEPRHFDYAASGAGGEATMRANRSAFDRYRVVPRVLRDVANRDLGVELFGRSVPAPVVLAPVGGQARYDAMGELATARAAAELRVPMTLSTQASRSIEDVAAANDGGPRLFQLYWPGDEAVAASLVERAEAAGYDGLVLTLDSQVPTWRPRVLEHVNAGSKGPRGVLETDPVVRQRAREQDRSVERFVRESPSLGKDASLEWDDLATVREWTDLPVALKGILAPEDARRAVDWGAEGLVVSNHGGRQIDGEVAALEQLPTIVDAVGDDTTILFDSGVRSGVDAFKALALGARAVLLGRPYVFGLAVAGERGVYETVLNCLAELESTMGLSGCATIDEIGRDALTEPSGDPAGFAD
jgi:isopentenyl diphosphate isomerase/L-lactate dehydrogenase-like FMN-dependent dehydrogenase